MKKFIISAISLLSITFCHNVLAGNLYFGPALILQNNTGPGSNYRGLSPRLSVGYAQMFEDDFYLAAEIFGTPASATVTDHHLCAASARTTRSIGLSLLPGMMITENVLGFVRVGVVDTLYPSPNTTRAGGQVGLGLQSCLTPHWDMRAEYIYTAYRTVPTVGAVKSDIVGLGFVYKVLS